MQNNSLRKGNTQICQKQKSLSSNGMYRGVFFNPPVAPPCKGVIAWAEEEIYTICYRSSGAQRLYILTLCKFCFNVLFYFILFAYYICFKEEALYTDK